LGTAERARLHAPLLLVARAHIADDVQLLPPVARGLLFLRLLGRRRLDTSALLLSGSPLLKLALAGFGLFARTLLGKLAGLLGLLLPELLFFDTAPVLGLEPLVLASLGFGALGFRARGSLGLAPLRFDVFLLLPGLLLQHVALDVRALAAHLDVHGARAALGARELQLALRLA